MNNKAIPWIILAAVIVIGAVVWSMNRADDSMMKDEMMEKSSEETMIEDDKMMEGEDKMMDGEDKMMEDDKMMDQGENDGAMMEKSGAYKDYSTATVAAEQADGNKVVLFFHATWCPYCQAADAAFKAKGDEIPAGVTVLKTDYDSNTELKTKYGVTTQHTFVQIDNDGKQVAKWVSGDTAELKANLK